MVLSVSSSVTHWGGTPMALMASRTNGKNSISFICTEETLMLILKSGTILRHFLQVFSASSTIQRPTGRIIFVSSRIGMNSIGETIFPSGFFQRSSASAPISLFVRASICG